MQVCKAAHKILLQRFIHPETLPPETGALITDLSDYKLHNLLPFLTAVKANSIVGEVKFEFVFLEALKEAGERQMPLPTDLTMEKALANPSLFTLEHDQAMERYVDKLL